MSRLVESVRRANRPQRPEGSVALRVATLVAVLLAIVGIGMTGAASPTDVIAAFVALPVGAYVSHRLRGSTRLGLKALLALAAIAALWRFFAQLEGAATLEDTRLPLADLFIAVQVIHGFDLPQRRDLGFSLAASLALVALAGVDARSAAFALVLVGYLVAVGVASTLMQRSAARERAEGAVGPGRLGHGVLLAASGPASDPATGTAPGRPTVARVRRATGFAGAGLSALVLGGALFLVMPRSDGVQLGGLPFDGFGSDEVGSGRVVNAGLPHGGTERPADGAAFNPESYFGFAELIDLRSRGELSDDLVMRVRTDRPRLWRGMVFDRYEDSAWTRTAEEPDPTTGIPVTLRPPEPDTMSGRAVVQTFELETSTPNLIFAAAEPRSVYHAAGAVSHWDDGTMTTGAEQEPGIVYSVLSRVPDADASFLRAQDAAAPDELAATYLQLPDELPDRVRDLAAGITAGAGTPYEKAEAVEAWLGANTEYTLDLTPQPAGADAVDWFLFEQRRGWCEPIATSMVVLLRSEGVPARLATGFAPGPRNPITGWYEARMSDAHAWVEVFVPRVGWVTMDPTARVPSAVAPDAVSPRIAAIDLARWLADRDVGPRLLAAGRAALPWATPLVLLAGLAALGHAARRRRAAAPSTPFERAEALLARQGVPRQEWQTPREYVTSVRERRPDLPNDALERVLLHEEARRYAGRRAGAAEDGDDDPGRDVDELERVLSAATVRRTRSRAR